MVFKLNSLDVAKSFYCMYFLFIIQTTHYNYFIKKTKNKDSHFSGKRKMKKKLPLAGTKVIRKLFFGNRKLLKYLNLSIFSPPYSFTIVSTSKFEIFFPPINQVQANFPEACKYLDLGLAVSGLM